MRRGPISSHPPEMVDEQMKPLKMKRRLKDCLLTIIMMIFHLMNKRN